MEGNHLEEDIQTEKGNRRTVADHIVAAEGIAVAGDIVVVQGRRDFVNRSHLVLDRTT